MIQKIQENSSYFSLFFFLFSSSASCSCFSHWITKNLKNSVLPEDVKKYQYFASVSSNDTKIKENSYFFFFLPLRLVLVRPTGLTKIQMTVSYRKM